MARFTQSLQPNDPTIYTIDQKLELGAEGVTPDGRKYVYGRQNASTAALVGKLYQSMATTTGWQSVACAASAIGSYTITTTGTITATLNQLAGGYVVVNTLVGVGWTYKIKGNTAASGAVCTITLEDPIKVALDATSTIDIIAGPFSFIEIWDYSNHDGTVVGVAAAPITASYYGWYQKKGPCGLLIDSSNVAVGVNVYASAAVDGAGGPTGTYTRIGTAITAGSSGEYAMVDLNI
jgi:hypothetical protein